jgi:hypothetical protein
VLTPSADVCRAPELRKIGRNMKRRPAGEEGTFSYKRCKNLGRSIKATLRRAHVPG